MHYSILIYAADGVFDRLPAEEQERMLQDHRDLQEKLRNRSKGEFAVARLMHVNNAVTIKPTTGKEEKPLIVDGPFAETKERFMGFYVIECETLDEALEYASALATPHNSIEVRPVAWAGGILDQS